MKNEEFYKKCAEILKLDYIDCSFKYKYRTRWNNRTPGSGRFNGYGIIRKFNDNLYHIAFKSSKHWAIYNNENDVYNFLYTLV